MEQQSAPALLMIRPSHFGFNPETAPSNAFQKASTDDPKSVQTLACHEFDVFVSELKARGLLVHVFGDLPTPVTPDAVFPNNWVSFHSDGTVVLYPMLAENRRLERRPDILSALSNDLGYRVSRVVDLTTLETAGEALEGTGSLVLDRVNRLAYACMSPRTSQRALERFAEELGYTTISFAACDEYGRPFYHTNVVMSVGDRFSVVCTEAIRDTQERATVQSALTKTNHEIIDISLKQVADFAGNVLQVRSTDGNRFVLMSTKAAKAFTHSQLAALSRDSEVVSIPLDTIETIGGGSARCMIAEVFLPAQRVEKGSVDDEVLRGLSNPGK